MINNIGKAAGMSLLNFPYQIDITASHVN